MKPAEDRPLPEPPVGGVALPPLSRAVVHGPPAPPAPIVTPPPRRPWKRGRR